MPRNQFQRIVFALLTVIVTVHAYVFYSLYVVNGSLLRQITGEGSVLKAVKHQGGVYMFGNMLPIWAIVIVEFCFAFALECAIGSPMSFRLARRMFDPQKTHPMIFETVIICSTVLIMCPCMSLIAAAIYYPYYAGFNIFTLLADWLKLICYNFPFAFFSQIFFIQPLVRFIFGKIFKRDIAAHKQALQPPQDEQDVIADILHRMDELQNDIAHERRQRKKLAQRVTNDI